MLPPGEPKFRRRPADRPAEILAAALEVFAARGFQAARLEEVAKRAGVSKGALYLYFETKADLFRAVVTDAISPNIDRVRAVAAADLPLEQVARLALPMLARQVVSDRRITGVVKLVIAESRNHPELAAIWRETVVEPGVQLISGLIAKAQARGEVRAGDPRLFAFGLMGPMVLSMVWRETFEPVGAEPVDVVALAEQHVETVLKGMRP
ncbi:MAG: TetR/AcrR family transcriptional regulator [Brevundimonas sp.]|jgi:AcrR family transcriptional regulator|uniref:TetR/AcrR family transcriptional regulator n=1 Tax=Brevundimonas sp. TaxID=1871086 RepID=UPI001849C814|nr:TetR/AcrR family transcriptional regulator [Brevundimonas sp.]MBA4805237.1 TetR/AcrR family transcriptional regulator [Brevundimonas sp.]